ncbi:hypothetical protein AX17_006391 [Amanita inopinata Kibby_2008]|nr:hypothetical protein AX17_006391 [Amanita inopinata Kibby_2008]
MIALTIKREKGRQVSRHQEPLNPSKRTCSVREWTTGHEERHTFRKHSILPTFHKAVGETSIRHARRKKGQTSAARSDQRGVFERCHANPVIEGRHAPKGHYSSESRPTNRHSRLGQGSNHPRGEQTPRRQQPPLALLPRHTITPPNRRHMAGQLVAAKACTSGEERKQKAERERRVKERMIHYLSTTASRASRNLDRLEVHPAQPRSTSVVGKSNNSSNLAQGSRRDAPSEHEKAKRKEERREEATSAATGKTRAQGGGVYLQDVMPIPTLQASMLPRDTIPPRTKPAPLATSPEIKRNQRLHVPTELLTRSPPKASDQRRTAPTAHPSRGVYWRMSTSPLPSHHCETGLLPRDTSPPDRRHFQSSGVYLKDDNRIFAFAREKMKAAPKGHYSSGTAGIARSDTCYCIRRGVFARCQPRLPVAQQKKRGCSQGTLFLGPWTLRV